MGILDDAIREHLDLKRRRGADPAEVERLEREALGPVRRGGFEQQEDVLHPDYPPDLDYDLEGSEPAYAGEVPAEPAYADEIPEAAYPDEADPDWVEPAEDHTLIDEAPPHRPVPAADPHPGAEPFVETEPEPHAEAEPFAAAEHPPPAEPFAEAEPGPAPDQTAEAPPTTPRHHEIVEAWDAHEALHGEPAAPPPPAGPVPDQADRAAERPGTLEEETAEYDVEAEHEEGDADDMLEETPDFLQDTPDHDRLWFEQRPPRDFDFGG
jgi:hypothetical protein